MPNIDLDLIKLSYDVKFPTIDFDVDIDVPKEIPKVGGKSWRLKSFSLNVTEPKITIPVDAEFFGGSISVELNFARCEIEISGEISADVVVKKFRWHIGPEHVEYMKPFRLKEPSWSVHPKTLDAAQLQTLVDAAPAATLKSGPTIRNDDETKAKIAELFIFHGGVHLIETLIKAAADFVENLARDAEGKPSDSAEKPDDSAEKPDDSAEKVDDSAKRPKESAGADKPAASGGKALFALAIPSVSAGYIAGGAAARGFYVTTDHDFGTFGTVAFDGGAIAELSAGLSFIVYWSDEHQSAEDCFKGNNLFVTGDIGEVVGVGVTISWPETAILAPTTANPCGVAISMGGCVGWPLNFVIGNSTTWLNLKVPQGVQRGGRRDIRTAAARSEPRQDGRRKQYRIGRWRTAPDILGTVIPARKHWAIFTEGIVGQPRRLPCPRSASGALALQSRARSDGHRPSLQARRSAFKNAGRRIPTSGDASRAIRVLSGLTGERIKNSLAFFLAPASTKMIKEPASLDFQEYRNPKPQEEKNGFETIGITERPASGPRNSGV